MNDIISYPIHVNGVLSRVLESGEGPQVAVFVHGVGARADRWRKNLPVLAAKGLRCIAIDLPGHGFAHKGDGFDYGVPGYARYVGGVMDVLNLDSAHFIGTSLGAHILATLLLQRPGSARSLSLIGATGMFPIGAEQRQRIATRITDLSREGIATKLNSLIFDPALVTPRLVEEEWRINNSPGARASFDALGAYFRDRLDADVVGPALVDAMGPLPRLLVWGESDRSVPLSIGRQVEQLLGTPLLSLPSAAHAPYWEVPELFNKAMGDFLVRASA